MKNAKSLVGWLVVAVLAAVAAYFIVRSLGWGTLSTGETSLGAVSMPSMSAAWPIVAAVAAFVGVLLLRLFRFAWGIALWVALAAVAIIAAFFFKSNPGAVDIQWLGWQFKTENIGIFFVLALIAVVLLAMLLWAVLRLIAMPKNMRQKNQGKRREMGYQALSQGLVALAAGDSGEAKRQAKRVDKLLEQPPITNLITAQAAQLDGDEKAARRYFTEMLKRPETKFLGLRGLVNQSMRSGRDEEALLLAREANRMQPDSKWALESLVELEARNGNMVEAEAAIRERRSLSHVDTKTAKRQQAVMMAGAAAKALEEGDTKKAVASAKAAQKLNKEVNSAHLLEAKAHLVAGKNGAAASAVERGWKAGPNEAFIPVYLEAKGHPEGEKRNNVLDKLASVNTTAPLSFLLRAELAIDRADYGAARIYVNKAQGIEETARGFRVLAALDQAENNDSASAQENLIKAMGARRDGQWQCSNCGNMPGEWEAVCSNCSQFDTVEWTEQQGNMEAVESLLEARNLDAPKDEVIEAKKIEVLPPPAKD